MIKIKDKKAIDKMRLAGSRLAAIMEKVGDFIKPGMTTLALNNFVEQEMIAAELKPVCKGFGSYKHATCISVNDGVVHGVPTDTCVLQSGDLVKVDVVGSYKGYCTDMARCYFVGGLASATAQKLAAVAREALDCAIERIRPGIHLSDISACIQQVVEREGFGVVRVFAGHGIGKDLHEAPEIPNFGRAGQGPRLRVGMTLAIEPMITAGGYDVVIGPDGWTAKTKDGSLAGHVEDTVLVTENGAEILTKVVKS